MPVSLFSRRLGAALLLTACAACDDGGGDPTSDAVAAQDGGVADMGRAPDAEPMADAQPGDALAGDAQPGDAGPDAAVDAGPRPNALRPGWCSRTDLFDGEVTGVTTRSYDRRGRVVEEVFTGMGANPDRRRTTFEWDDADRIVRKVGQLEGADYRYPDETYAYTADGLLREATQGQPGGMEVLRFALASASGRYTGLRTYVNDNPTQTYETLEWDAQTGQLMAFNTRLTATDEVVQFQQYGYKARNPGQGKLESESRDADRGDGLVDSRTTYRYEPMMGILEGRSFQLVDAQGSPQGEPTTFTWSHLILDGFHQVEAVSVNGEVRETYVHGNGTVEVTIGCDRFLYEGRIAEIQRPGGLFGFTPEAGGTPQLGGASADFAPSGRLLRQTGCDGRVAYEATFDEVGNLLGEDAGATARAYTYACWE